MSVYVVEYTVPVRCHVDTDTNRIVKVVVVDEAIEITDDVYDEDYVDLELDDPMRAKARTIAEEVLWPSWHRGF